MKKLLKWHECADKYWMRVALLISGEFREFEIAHKFWPFLQWEGLDIYFSLWSTSNIVYSSKYSETEHINYRLINSVNPKAICVEAQPVELTHNAIKMIHRIKKGFELILNSGIEYDIVITVRPDFISYVKNEYYIEQVKKAYTESIVLIDGISEESSGDSFLIYPIKYVREYLAHDFNQYINWTKPFFLRMNIHHMYCHFFKDKANSMDYLTTRWSIVRANSRKLSPGQKKSFRILTEYSARWWEEKSLNKYNRPKYDPDCP